MQDQLIRLLAAESGIRAFVCRTTQTVQTACKRHQTKPTASVALGRALTGAALFGALLKGRQRVALKFEGNGPLQKILVGADALCRVHGYVGSPDTDLPLRDGKFDIANALGQAGLLTVRKDLLLKEPYSGVTTLQTSEIAEDLAWYLTESEQIPSAMGLTALPDETGNISLAGGFLLQALPGANMAVLDAVTAKLQQISCLGQHLRTEESLAHIAQKLFGDIEWEYLGRQDVEFFCGCSQERVEQALVTLGVEAILNLAQDTKSPSLTCEFCRQEYFFSLEELQRLATECH